MIDNETRRHLRDLFDEQDRMLAKANEPLGSPLVQREAHGALLYRVQESDAEAPAAEPVSALSTAAADDDENARNSAGWNAWAQGHIAAERDFTARALGCVIAELRHEWRTERDAAIAALKQEFGESIEDRDRKFTNEFVRYASVAEHAEMAVTALVHRVGQLEREVAELRAREQIRSERGAEIAEVTRNANVGRFNLQERTLERELAVRDGKIEKLEAQLAMLLKFLSLQGLDPPNGL
jgi:hypothetical protein